MNSSFDEIVLATSVIRQIRVTELISGLGQSGVSDNLAPAARLVSGPGQEKLGLKQRVD